MSSGRIFTHRVNEGVVIDRDGHAIDIVVKGITGTHPKREVKLQVIGVPSLEEGTLKADEPLRISDDLILKLCEGERYNQRRARIEYITVRYNIIPHAPFGYGCRKLFDLH